MSEDDFASEYTEGEVAEMERYEQIEAAPVSDWGEPVRAPLSVRERWEIRNAGFVHECEKAKHCTRSRVRYNGTQWSTICIGNCETCRAGLTVPPFALNNLRELTRRWTRTVVYPEAVPFALSLPIFEESWRNTAFRTDPFQFFGKPRAPDPPNYDPDEDAWYDNQYGV